MEDAKSTQKTADYAQEGDEFVEARPWTFEKNLLGAPWRRCQCRA
jgi:hypothetical protein